MILIAHRGNTKGPNKELENSPQYIDKAIEEGYDVEVDLWSRDGKVFLGHDAPEYQICEKWIQQRVNNLWVHCKNTQSLNFVRIYGHWDRKLKYFWHQEDDYTFTSNGFIWTYPGKPLSGCGKDICVMPEKAKYSEYEILKCWGICSDYVEKYR